MAVGTRADDVGFGYLALAINGGITLAVHRGRRDLNVRTVWIHNLGDALSNVAIFAGAIVIRLTGAKWVDPALGIAIGAMVLWSGAGILRESGHILLEGLPREHRIAEVATRCLARGRRAGSARHSYLDAGHRISRAFLPRPHSGHAHGGERKSSRCRFAKCWRAIFTSRTRQFSLSGWGCPRKRVLICRSRLGAAASKLKPGAGGLLLRGLPAADEYQALKSRKN